MDENPAENPTERRAADEIQPNAKLRLRDELRAIRERCAALPMLDDRSADELLEYDEIGLPGGWPPHR